MTMLRLISHAKLTLIIIWLVAIAVRIYGISTPPQHYDMGTYHAWAHHFLNVGSQAFFGSTWSDYLPLPIMSFAIPGWIAKVFELDFGVVFKSFHSLIELVLILAIAKVAQLAKHPVILALLLLSPALIGDTAFWGQVDTVPALLTVLSFVLVLKNPDLSNQSVVTAAISYGLAVAYKPIMILVAPILWVITIKKSKWLQLPLIAGATFFATTLPFVGQWWQTFSFLISRILDQAGTYRYTTVNAWNIWSLNPVPHWPSDTQTVLGVSPHTLGLCLFFACTAVLLNNWRKARFDLQYSYRVAASIMVLFFALTTRMHERHLLFGLPLLTLALIYERWLVVPLLLLTSMFTLNLYGAFYWVNHNQVWPFEWASIALWSWITTLTALGLGLVWQWPSLLRWWGERLKAHKLFVVILVLASMLRFVNLSHPQTYIFDEVYHAFTAREYLNNNVEAWEWWTTPPEGVAFEWTHPPLAKYGMVLGMLLFGENSLGWRVGSAVAGIISIIGIYLLTLAVTKKKGVASLAALLVTIEGLHIAQSRVAMNDLYMLACFVWSLYAAVRSRWRLSAVLYGLALASKWSALYGIIPLAFIYLNTISLKSFVASLFHHLVFVLRLMLIALSVYVLSFAPFILAGHTWEQFVELHRQMWYYHTHLVATHAYQSTPKEWIFALRPVWYWVEYGAKVSHIYAQGNPLVLWGGLVALILMVKKIRLYPYSLFFILYTVFTLPWIISPRIMFFYHYLPSATFLCIILASWLATLPPRIRNIVVIVCFISLIIMSPILYGYPMLDTYWNTIFKLVPSWK